MKKNISYLLMLMVVSFTPSCLRYYKLVKTEFPQGKEKKDHRDIAYNYLRSTKVYDQFSTQAIFHTLWLSDDVRAAYVDAYSSRRGKEGGAKDALFHRQLEENKHWITMYVHADVRQRERIALSDKNSTWTMYLQTHDGKKVEPISIKEIDLEPEYRVMFSHRFDPFRSTYLVKFPAADLDGRYYVDENKPFKLVIASPFKSTMVEWDKENRKKHAKLLKDEDFYWG